MTVRPFNGDTTPMINDLGDGTHRAVLDAATSGPVNLRPFSGDTTPQINDLGDGVHRQVVEIVGDFGGATPGLSIDEAPTVANPGEGDFVPISNNGEPGKLPISWFAPATAAAAFMPQGKFGHFFNAAPGATALYTNGASGVTFQATGTATGLAPDTTNFGKRPKIRWASAATSGSFINVRHAGNGVVSSRQTGFDFDCVWGHSDAAAVADARSFIGVRGNTGDVGNVNPSTLTQIIGVGNDGGEANLQLMYNDGTGVATKIDLGANFPANTVSADMYRLRLWCAPGASAVSYRLDRLDTAFFVEGTVSTDIPPSTTMLGYTVFRGNGGTALAVRYDVSYLEMYPRALL